MSKTRKNNVLLIILAILFVSPIFVACGSVKVQLNEPTFVNYQISADTGKQILITDKNPNASGYIFGMSATSGENDDLSNYITYRTTGSQNNYFDVTNIFLDATTYYFYAQAIGSGNYTTSVKSEVFNCTVEKKLEKPVLSINGEVLSWSSVSNAQTYSVYANSQKISSSTTSTSYDFSNYIATNQTDIPYSFVVSSDAHDSYLRSADSNAVEYTKHLQLSIPEDLKITNVGDKKNLSWSSVKNANKYVVSVNGEEIEVDGKTTFDIMPYYKMLGEYNIKVKSIGEGYYISSDYSDIITDTLTQMLNSPSNTRAIVNASDVMVSWDSVDNAQTYSMYIDGTLYELNQSGVESPVTATSLILTFDDLNISSGTEVSKKTLQVMANGYGYYTSSSKTTVVDITYSDKILATPIISLDEENTCIIWNKIDKATSYKVSIAYNNSTTYITTNIIVGDDSVAFYYSSYLTNAGSYTVKVCAVAEDTSNNSQYSNSIKIEKYSKLTAPSLTKVGVTNQNYVFIFTADTNANNFAVYANNNLVSESLTLQNNKIATDTVDSICENATDITFYLVSLAVNYYEQSDRSNEFDFSKLLSTPQNLSISNNILTWSAVENAEDYVILIDDNEVETNSNVTSFDLTTKIAQDETRQVRVYAKTSSMQNSVYSQTLYFNNVLTKQTNYTDKYFYYGKTYDYYMTSQKEMNDLIEYSFFNSISTIKFYANYSSSTSIATKVKTAIDNLTGTMGFSYNLTSQTDADKAIGTATLSITYYEITSAPNYKSTITQYSKLIAYSTSSPRDASYDEFVTDDYVVSQDVYTTDGLLSAVQNKARPNFVGDSIAQNVYTKAKQILRSICDDTMSNYQKALAIHDYLVWNVSYDTYGLQTVTEKQIGYFHYIESALLYNLGVCDAYAKSFALMCEMEGIDTLVISGSTDSNDVTNTGHAWNEIFVDGNGDGTSEWLFVDCTYDDCTTTIDSTQYEVLSHGYFMVCGDYLSSRYMDRTYETSTISNARYFDTQKISENTRVVDSVSQFNSIKSYVKANYGTVGAEILIKKTINNTCIGISKLSIDYYADSSYYWVILYN